MLQCEWNLTDRSVNTLLVYETELKIHMKRYRVKQPCYHRSITVLSTIVDLSVWNSSETIYPLSIGIIIINYHGNKAAVVEFASGPMPAADVQPYARSSPDWLETIISSQNRHYEPFDNENSSITRQRPRCYGNLAPDGSVNLPPHLKNIFLDFERYYENTHYKRLRRYVTKNEYSDGFSFPTILSRWIWVDRYNPLDKSAGWWFIYPLN